MLAVIFRHALPVQAECDDNALPLALACAGLSAHRADQSRMAALLVTCYLPVLLPPRSLWRRPARQLLFFLSVVTGSLLLLLIVVASVWSVYSRQLQALSSQLTYPESKNTKDLMGMSQMNLLFVVREMNVYSHTASTLLSLIPGGKLGSGYRQVRSSRRVAASAGSRLSSMCSRLRRAHLTSRCSLPALAIAGTALWTCQLAWSP